MAIEFSVDKKHSDPWSEFEKDPAFIAQLIITLGEKLNKKANKKIDLFGVKTPGAVLDLARMNYNEFTNQEIEDAKIKASQRWLHRG